MDAIFVPFFTDTPTQKHILTHSLVYFTHFNPPRHCESGSLSSKHENAFTMRFRVLFMATLSPVTGKGKLKYGRDHLLRAGRLSHPFLSIRFLKAVGP